MLRLESRSKSLCYGSRYRVRCVGGTGKVLHCGTNTRVPRFGGISRLLCCCITSMVLCYGDKCTMLRLGSRT